MKNKEKENNEKNKVTGKTMDGVIVSAKIENTVVVAIKVRKSHPFYGKIMSSTKKYMAHTEKKLKVGDKVRIIQTVPISKKKKWRVLEILS